MKTTALSLIAGVGMAMVALTGCVSQSKFLDDKEMLATMTAATRAQIILNCQNTDDATVLARQVVTPPYYGPLGGVDRLAEYTVDVKGCGKETVIVVACPDGDRDCFAAGPPER